jgi:hypothetical protein
MLLINKKRYVNLPFETRDHTPILTVSHRKPVNPLLQLTRWFPRDVINLILAKLNKFDIRQCLRACYVNVPMQNDDCYQIIALNIVDMFDAINLRYGENHGMIVKYDRVGLLEKAWEQGDVMYSSKWRMNDLLEVAIKHKSMQCLRFILPHVEPSIHMAEIETVEQLECIHAQWPNAHIKNTSSRMPLYITAAHEENIPVLQWLHDHYAIFPPNVFDAGVSLRTYKQLIAWGYEPTYRHRQLIATRDELDKYIALHEAGMMNSEFVRMAALAGSKHVVTWYHAEYGVPDLVLVCGHVGGIKALACTDALPENSIDLVASEDHTYRYKTLDYLQSRGHMLTASALAHAITSYHANMVTYLCEHRCPSPDIDFLVAKLYEQGDMHGMRMITRILEQYNYI